MARDLRGLAATLGQLYEAKVSDERSRIRVEDLLSAGAAACGEACIAAAGEIDPTNHDVMPGSPVLSATVNGILCADATDWSQAGESVFGIIRTGALAQGYTIDDFPAIEPVMLAYVGALAGGAQVGWGFVPLTVPEANHPFVQPLRQAYELRSPVRKALSGADLTRREWPAACALALVVELVRVRDAIDRGVAIRLVLETVNGMAKTAPMTERHMREAMDSGPN